jgi:hypothetical protein
MNWGKEALLSKTYPLKSSNGARLLLIAISGVLFAVLKGRGQQKRHWSPPVKHLG